MNKQMKVVICEPNQIARIETIDGSLEGMQKIVNDLICPFYLTDDILILCGDCSKLRGLPLNRVIRDEDGEGIEAIAGTFFICKDDGEEFTSLSDDEAQEYLEIFKYPEFIFVYPNEVVGIPYDPSAFDEEEL